MIGPQPEPGPVMHIPRKFLCMPGSLNLVILKVTVIITPCCETAGDKYFLYTHMNSKLPVTGVP